MKKTLIALAAASLLGTGAASAGPAAIDGARSAAFIPTQHRYDAPQHSYDYQPSYRGHGDDRIDQGREFSIDERQARLRERIQRGVDNGRLTRREAFALSRDLDAIEARERSFEADGRLGRREREALHADLDRLTEHLRAEARDGERR